MNEATLERTISRDPWSPAFIGDFGDFLLRRGALSAETLRRTERAARETGERFDLVLTRLGLVSESDMARHAAAYLELPLMVAADLPDELPAVPGLDPEFLRRSICLPLHDEEDGDLVVAVADPFREDTAAALSFHLCRPVRITVGTAAEITSALARIYGERGHSERVDATSTLATSAVNVGAGEEDIRRLTDLASEAPVVRLVHDTIQRAVEADASDIHIESTDDGLIIRQRIDGELDTAMRLPSNIGAAVFSFIQPSSA